MNAVADDLALADPNPDERIDKLLAAVEYDALLLASTALAAEREARFGDNIPALRDSVKTARLVVIRMLKALSEIEAVNEGLGA
jgi:hypothetical protein